ncbi:RNA methyltransferase [Thermosipho ferrireducens]|uniref:RNA methyltransferase n=1 Tax=Thermosipho ferrireducens TaxID=2571116 RepID=A0ABX7S4E7_9BACT|nr:RNA methyltransferase [Thermosipho ferrireducens]QTA37312.1 RNA methyltransferase [Thermosipho ferrireducens]
MKLLLTCTAGLEGAVALELKELNYKIISSTSGRILIDAEVKDVPELNLLLRSAERVLWLIVEHEVKTFDELFEVTYNTDWKSIIDKDGLIVVSDIVTRNSVVSAKGAIASVVKAAIYKKLSPMYLSSKRKEKIYPIRIIIKNNVLQIFLDTTGKNGLNKRGYRKKASKAPLRETIAAGLVILSRWKKEIPLIDPFCGSGTILIEAALLSNKMLPGLRRDFVSQNWSVFKESWNKTREILRVSYCQQYSGQDIRGYDIDKKVLNVANENARNAGVDFIRFFQSSFDNIPGRDDNVYIITNPPYGSRLQLEPGFIKRLNILWKKFPEAKIYILSPEKDFEKKLGIRATKKFRFQNSGLWIWYYMFY